ncbi:MAG: TonB-dependent receptor [Deinococcales bacterium]|nr:TonB-dependent receptor [Chitinophagaceae bacterium]
MKLTFAQILFAALFTSVLYANDTRGQVYLDKPISISANEVEIKKVINEIEKQTSVLFVYSPKAIQASRRISCNISNKKLGDFLNDVFKSLNIGFSTSQNGNEQIVLYNITKPSTVTVTLLPNALEPTTFVTKTETTAYSSIPITGRVLNEKGLPISGASISEKGTTNVAIADDNGNFKINVKDNNSILVISDVNSVTKEIAIGKQKLFTINLKESSKDLTEVLIVGYGTQKKVTNTGAQSSLSGAKLIASPAANISNSLVGRVSGLFATQSSGEPGADQSQIRIRGVGTFNGSTDPLVLVDGIQVDNYNSIDANEIENVTVLKDAASTAVYGIRGANGVMIISTKRGKEGKAKVSYTFNNAINSFTKQKEQMNSYDYANSFNQALKNDAYVLSSTYVPRYSQSELDKYKATVDNLPGADPIFYPNVDWFKEIFKKSTTQQQHNFNITGGTDKVKFATSVGYFNQEGLLRNTTLSPGYDAQLRFQRFNFRSNLNFNITKSFKAAVDISSQIENRTGNNLSTTTYIDNVQRSNPLSAPGIIDGKVVILQINGANQSNPYTGLYQGGYKREYRGYLNGSVRLDHDLDFITKGLTTHFQVAYQNYNGQLVTNNKTNGTIIPYVAIKQPDGTTRFLPQNEDGPFSYAETIGKNRRTTFEFAIDYKRKFGNHNVSGLVLYNQQKSIDPTFSFGVPSGYQSYVGRATYDYKGRYIAEVNLAYNGTENFAPGKRFGVFPAYSLGWIASDEKFFPKNDLLTFLKVRGSYGEVGNDQIGSGFLYSGNRFLFRPTAWTYGGAYRYGEVATGYNQATGAFEGRVSNPDLTWERAIKTNLGIEATFFKKSLVLVVDLFKETRHNILTTPQTISGFYAATVPALNIGKMENKGFEIDLTYNNDIGKYFTYQIKGNYSFAHNTILFQDEITRKYGYQQRTGQRFGQIFGFIDEGFYNTWGEVNDAKRPIYGWQGNKLQPGDIRYKDVNGDGKVDNDDAVPIGYSNIPEKTYGLSLSGQYKGFSFSALFQGAGNVSLQYSRRINQAFYDAQPAGALNNLLESWTPERYAAGLPIKYPRFSLGTNGNVPNNYQSSTFFTVDASYIRLKNVEVGYTFNGSTLKKVGLNTIRVFVNANNLATFTKVAQGVDPENPTLAANNEPYPLVRTINMGININF